MMTAIGLMSGTSMDGIDLALIRTDGEDRVSFGPSLCTDYGVEERAALRRALRDAAAIRARGDRPGCLHDVERTLTARHAALVLSFLADNGLAARDIDVIGFHGQTVLHRPQDRLTVQIGDGPALAEATGIDVVHDLRGADVAAGGQGAPFVPIFHKALARSSGLAEPACVVNIGGVGNITYLAPGCDPVAFDTGPGNALLDDMMLERTGKAMDGDGITGLTGAVQAGVLAILMGHPFFLRAPPKSLDRNDFSWLPAASLATSDAAATLAAFTAASIAEARRWLPAEPRAWVVCGGGARNPVILRELTARVPGTVMTAEQAGWSAGLVEAQAFAYLAVRSLRGLPLSFPTTTGVPRAMTGGILSSPTMVSA